MVRITPVKPITLAKEWRPWSALIYDEVKLKEKFWSARTIIVYTLIVLPAALCIALIIALIISSAAKKLRERRRDFRRFEEEGTPQARASPPTRTTEMV